MWKNSWIHLKSELNAWAVFHLLFIRMSIDFQHWTWSCGKALHWKCAVLVIIRNTKTAVLSSTKYWFINKLICLKCIIFLTSHLLLLINIILTLFILFVTVYCTAYILLYCFMSQCDFKSHNCDSIPLFYYFYVFVYYLNAKTQAMHHLFFYFFIYAH